MPNIFIFAFIIYTLACFTIHILFNYNNTGAFMSSSISYSPIHNGSFIVTHSDGTQVPCHNLSTAKVVAGLVPQCPTQHASAPEQITVEEYYGCELGGLGHTPAITWTITGRVERVHNWATAQTIVSDNEKLRARLS